MQAKNKGASKKETPKERLLNIKNRFNDNSVKSIQDEENEEKDPIDSKKKGIENDNGNSRNNHHKHRHIEHNQIQHLKPPDDNSLLLKDNLVQYYDSSPHPHISHLQLHFRVQCLMSR